MKREDFQDIKEIISDGSSDPAEAEDLMRIAESLVSLQPFHPSAEFQQELKRKLEKRASDKCMAAPVMKRRGFHAIISRLSRPASVVVAAAAVLFVLNMTGVFSFLPLEEKNPKTEEPILLEEKSTSPRDVHGRTEGIDAAMIIDNNNGNNEHQGDDRDADNKAEEPSGKIGKDNTTSPSHGEEIGESATEADTPPLPNDDAEPDSESEEEELEEIIVTGEVMGDIITQRDLQLPPLVLGEAAASEPARATFKLRKFPRFAQEEHLYHSFLQTWSEEEAYALGNALGFDGKAIRPDGDIVFNEEGEDEGRLLSFFVEDGRAIYYHYFMKQKSVQVNTAAREDLVTASEALATVNAFLETIGVESGELASIQEGSRDGRSFWEIVFYPSFQIEKELVTSVVARVDREENKVIYFSLEKAGLEKGELVQIKSEGEFRDSLKQIEVFASEPEVTLIIKDVEKVYKQRELRSLLHRSVWEPIFRLRGESQGGIQFTYYLPALN
ncbi:MAG: hypothetical protein GX767_01950 [Firmicutes bacterium]|nr:hypothetical protein [Bacillota bacterium]